MAEPQIDVAAALSALETLDPEGTDIGGSQMDPTQPRAAANKPAAEPVETEPVEGTTPPEETPDFTSIPDDALTPELLQMKRSLQADYTRKMQEAAPWRALSKELEMDDPEQFKAAGEVYKQLADPRNWPAFHAELSGYMQEYGMAPAAADKAASTQLESLVTPPDDSEVWEEYEDESGSGGVSPQVIAAFQAQQKEIAELKAHFQTQAAKEAEAEQTQRIVAIAQRMDAKEKEIRAANPHYTDNDITVIYNLVEGGKDPVEGLVDAQLRYESLMGERVSQYINKKETKGGSVPAPVPGGGITPAEPPKKLTVEEGHAKAMALAAQLDAEDA